MRTLLCLMALNIALKISAQPGFRMPTPNLTLFDGQTSAAESFFAPTQSGHWETGRYGCTRTSGWQFHEGIDIKFTQQDKRGEPTDPIFATAGGTVCYTNQQPGLSNFGNYIIIGHQIEGLEIFSIYAHLSEIADGVVPGRKVEAGARIGTMGRTSNAGNIARFRAHLHFEITLAINEGYAEWFEMNSPGQTNDHGPWNGRNFLGLDPEQIFMEQIRKGEDFSLKDYIQGQESYFSVYIPKKSFPWTKRYKPLIVQAPEVNDARKTGYIVHFNGYGMPYQLSPTVWNKSEPLDVELIQVNGNLYDPFKCRRLLSRKGTEFQLSKTALDLIDLITFNGD